MLLVLMKNYIFIANIPFDIHFPIKEQSCEGWDELNHNPIAYSAHIPMENDFAPITANIPC